MTQTVYIVKAYRFGDINLHSYVVGVYRKQLAAIKAAEAEEVYRGGKYGCDVQEWAMDRGIEEDKNPPPKYIRSPTKPYWMKDKKDS